MTALPTSPASPAAVPPARGRTALICGIGGQDGGYLAAHLLGLGYRVVGTSRDAAGPFAGLVRLGIRARVTVESLAPTDPQATRELLARIDPDEVYNLAGQSSVGLSFQQPAETVASIVQGTLNLLEAIRGRGRGRPVRLFNAGSFDMFGDTGTEPACERTPPRPTSPYGIAKAAAFRQVARYREAHGIAACTGILANHESPLRSPRFVTQKIAHAACRIARGTEHSLPLGDLSVRRDWGWAPEYVVAMQRMLALDGPADLVLATGTTCTLEEFVAVAFAAAGLDWRQHVVRDPLLVRPTEIGCSRADPSRAAARLGWRATTTMPDVARLLVAARLAEPDAERHAA